MYYYYYDVLLLLLLLGACSHACTGRHVCARVQAMELAERSWSFCHSSGESEIQSVMMDAKYMGYHCKYNVCTCTGYYRFVLFSAVTNCTKCQREAEPRAARERELGGKPRGLQNHQRAPANQDEPHSGWARVGLKSNPFPNHIRTGRRPLNPGRFCPTPLFGPASAAAPCASPFARLRRILHFSP